MCTYDTIPLLAVPESPILDSWVIETQRSIFLSVEGILFDFAADRVELASLIRSNLTLSLFLFLDILPSVIFQQKHMDMAARYLSQHIA